MALTSVADIVRQYLKARRWERDNEISEEFHLELWYDTAADDGSVLELADAYVEQLERDKEKQNDTT